MSMTSLNKELVERDRQLLRLDNLFAESVGGRGRVAIISGPVASGKSALLYQFLDRAAEAGAQVLSAAASAAERTLPLGVVDQLFQSAQLPPEEAAAVARLFEDMLSDSWHGPSRLQEHHRAQILSRLYKALLRLSRDTPLVIAVDDAHYADLPSQQCLASLVRRLRGTKAMVVLTEGLGLQPGDPLVRAELRCDAHDRMIQLEPLSPDGCRELLASCPDLFPDDLALDAHAATGGNPLLLHALIEDARTAHGAARTDELVVGERFAEGYRTCLYRSGPAAPATAQGLAVLGERVGAAMLPRLLDASAETVGRTLDLLNRSGLLDDGRFRHPEARAAVVAAMEPDDYAVMHAKAAYLMHSHGESATAVSRHLVNADRIADDWGVTALVEAAEQALAHGDVEHALACLRAGEPACRTGRQRAEIVALLSRVKWRTNPSEALPYLSELVDAARDGHLDARHAAVPVGILLWHGRVEQAIEILDVFCDTEELTPAMAEGIGSAVLWLAFCYPGHSAHVRRYWAALGRKNAAETLSHRCLRALRSVLAGGPGAPAAADAELVLHRIRLNDETLAPAVAAIATLILTGATAAAAFWCDSLLDVATVCRARTWQAILLALRAEVALLRGDLAKARSDADEALGRVSLCGWGPSVGCALSTLVLAATESGDYAAAAEYLNEPVPADVTQTPFGLRYVHARGVYYLATGRVSDALIDFQACGQLAGRLGLDHPGLVPWRAGAAQAHLAAGRHRQARELISEQLGLLGAGQTRSRGVCLRILAETVELKCRPGLLRESIDLLKDCGDWLEAARAFAGLSAALNEAGEANRARLTLRTARHIAKQCQAHALLRTLYPQTAASPEAPAAFEPPAADLSEAESRVAGLAALGHTNREIAGLLFVTVSTVEQHLTRVYRKLGVSRRMDLPPGLDTASSTGA
jgi:DNA-binding CsgD family transcriptional regulator